MTVSEMPRLGPTPAHSTASWRGTLQLTTCALLFGSTFLVMQQAIAAVPPTAFLALRFSVAALVLAPLGLRRPRSPGIVRDGIIAGTAMTAGYVLQIEGLRTVSSSRSAFITYLLIVIVPLMEAALTRRRPRTATLVGIGIAVVGLALIVDPGGGASPGFGIGEVLTCGCAVAFAAYIVILGRLAPRHDPFRFTLVQLVFVAATCLLVTPFTGFGAPGPAVWIAVVYTGTCATALAFVLMVAGQRTVPPDRAALILLLELVGAAVLGFLAGERFGLRGAVGACCIVTAIVVSEWARRSEPIPASPTGMP